MVCGVHRVRNLFSWSAKAASCDTLRAVVFGSLLSLASSPWWSIVGELQHLKGVAVPHAACTAIT